MLVTASAFNMMPTKQNIPEVQVQPRHYGSTTPAFNNPIMEEKKNLDLCDVKRGIIIA